MSLSPSHIYSSILNETFFNFIKKFQLQSFSVSTVKEFLFD